MLAAYTCPNLFEEGTAVTIQEKLPPLGFYPEMPGDVVLAHQCSPETGDLTPAPLRLTRQRHFHTAFTGDTGYGKTVAAERMVYETTLHWQPEDDRARLRRRLAQAAQCTGSGRTRGDPSAQPGWRAALALEPSAGRALRAA